MFHDWIFRIVGIGAVGVLLDVLMSEGETNKYVKSIFALITVFVIVSPLPDLLNKKIDFDSLFGNFQTAITIDDGYLREFYLEKYEIQESEIKGIVAEKCGLEIDVKIYFVESCPEKIDVVYIYFENTVIDGENENKHINEVKEIVSRRLNIDKGKIIFRYG